MAVWHGREHEEAAEAGGPHNVLLLDGDSAYVGVFNFENLSYGCVHVYIYTFLYVSTSKYFKIMF